MKKVFIVLLVVLMLMAVFSTVALAADVGDAVAIPQINLSVFLVMLTLAVVIERLIELVKSKIAPAKLANWLWFIITSALGVLLCILFSIDMLAAMGFTGGAAAIIVSEVLTGIAIGAGSGFVHSLNTKLNEVKTFTDIPDTGGDPDEDKVDDDE